MARVLDEKTPAAGTDWGVREDAPRTSTLNVNVFPELSLTSEFRESVAQTEIIPFTLALTPLLPEGFF